MNLWLRLLWMLLTAGRRGTIAPVGGVSKLHFRVWPHDLDLSAHMNNGRYLTLMDLGRTDWMIATGLWKGVMRHRWTPILSAAKVRYRRELRLFRTFRLETRLVWWGENSVVMEQRFLTKNRRGAEVISAQALVRAGLYDRKAKAFVPVTRLMAEIGLEAQSPEPTPDVRAFIDAEEALKATR